MAKGFKVVAIEELPGRQRNTPYSAALEDFTRKGVKYARVEVDGVKPGSIVNGLKGAIEKAGLKGKVTARNINGGAYLERS